MAAFTVLDLDDPEVGVVTALTGNIGVGLGLGDGGRAGAGQPTPLSIEPGTRREDLAAPVQPIDLDENRAGGLVALGNDKRRHPGHLAAPDMCPNPEPCFQPCRHLSPDWNYETSYYKLPSWEIKYLGKE